MNAGPLVLEWRGALAPAHCWLADLRRVLHDSSVLAGDSRPGGILAFASALPLPAAGAVVGGDVDRGRGGDVSLADGCAVCVALGMAPRAGLFALGFWLYH